MEGSYGKKGRKNVKTKHSFHRLSKSAPIDDTAPAVLDMRTCNGGLGLHKLFVHILNTEARLAYTDGAQHHHFKR